MSNFERLSKEEDILVSDMEDGFYHGSVHAFAKGSTETIQNKSKTIDSEYINIEREENSTFKSIEHEKLVLYVKKESKRRRKSKHQENPETIKNRNKVRQKDSIDEESMDGRKTKDTSTERKTRIITASELVKKKEKLTLEMTKPV